jgi:protein gp37
MSDHSAIEWTDATWNPLRGCSRVSAGCQHCYAERVAARFSGPGMPYEGLIHPTTKGWNGSVRMVPEVLDQPLRWRKPRKVFVNSMSDLFHESVPDEWINQIFDVMERCSHSEWHGSQRGWTFAGLHTFQILTKRPARMLSYITARLAKKQAYADQFKNCPTEGMRNSPAAAWAKQDASAVRTHIWLGVSVEDQATADERIPLLLQCPAAVRWLSCEPLLGPLNVRGYLMEGNDPGRCASCGKGHGFTRCPNYGGVAPKRSDYEGGPAACEEFRRSNFSIGWVVAGGESGPGARPMHPDWARSLRDQCASAVVPFFFKQWGEWAPYDRGRSDNPIFKFDGPFTRYGKKLAGRLLDGLEHNAYPEVR